MKNKLADLHVLTADDEKTMHRLVSNVLHSLGFENITVANSGRAAIEILRKRRFDFIITDWRMGDLDGIDIVKFVRSRECEWPKTPIIMLTGNTEAHYVLTAINNGVDSYLIKPFAASSLTQRIRTIIENPRAFVRAPSYCGPDRRRVNKGPPPSGDRRKHK